MAKPFAIHPGEILLTEFMEPYGLTAYRLAKELCVPVPRVNDVVRGKRAISADTALRLGIYFGLPAQFWLNLQNDYDLRLAAKAGALQKIKPFFGLSGVDKHFRNLHRPSSNGPQSTRHAS